MALRSKCMSLQISLVLTFGMVKPYTLYFLLKMHYNSVITSTTSSAKCSFPLMLSDQNFHAFLISFMRATYLSPSHPLVQSS